MQLIRRALLVAALLLPCVSLSAQLANTDGTSAGTQASTGVLVKKATLDFNQTNTDNAVTLTAPKYRIRRITVTNCSASFGASLATLGVFTSTGGGGTAVVALGTMTALTASTKYLDLTLALTTDTLATATLYLRNGVTFGSAATCDVYVIGDVLN